MEKGQADQVSELPVPPSCPRVLALATCVALGASAAACNQSTPTPNQTQKPMANSSTLRDWMKLRDLPLAELRAKLGIRDADISTGGAYHKLRPVDKWRRPAAHPGFFIIQGDRLALIYVDDEQALADLHPDALRAELGEPEASLRSRAGKSVPLHVVATKGVAYAGKADRIYYLEIFPPMSLADYQAQIYEDPGVYRK
jgi:hypothetical protein